MLIGYINRVVDCSLKVGRRVISIASSSGGTYQHWCNSVFTSYLNNSLKTGKMTDVESQLAPLRADVQAQVL